jgi:anti-sigma-K factor RskA
VLASRTRNEAVLLVSGLPTVPSGRTYQAWVIGDGRPRSVGFVGAAPLGFGDLAGAVKVALTTEPAGGSVQPTTTPVVLFDLPT